MPVHVVQHPLVEDVLARLRHKTTPSEEFRQLSPTGDRLYGTSPDLSP